MQTGVSNFFAVFIRVLESGGSNQEMESGVTAGDYLHGFLFGTRTALSENERPSMTITVPRIDARVIGGLIALFERVVGLYASLIGVNAYHRPGVEAGMKAAASVLERQVKIAAALSTVPQTAEHIAEVVDAQSQAEAAYLLLEHLSANGRARIVEASNPGLTTFIRA